MKHNNSDSQLAAALNKPVVSGKLTDEEIWQWVEWIDKRCNFNDHQKDYVWFAIRQILKTNSACASSAKSWAYEKLSSGTAVGNSAAGQSGSGGCKRTALCDASPTFGGGIL